MNTDIPAFEQPVVVSRARGRYYLLPIYGELKVLHKTLFENTRKNIPKDVQFKVVAQMREDVRKMLIRIIHANEVINDNERISFLIENLKVIENIKLDLRTMRDCRYLTVSGFRKIATILKHCRRQTEGWALKCGAKKEDFPHYFKILEEEFEEEGI